MTAEVDIKITNPVPPTIPGSIRLVPMHQLTKPTQDDSVIIPDLKMMRDIGPDEIIMEDDIQEEVTIKTEPEFVECTPDLPLDESRQDLLTVKEEPMDYADDSEEGPLTIVEEPPAIAINPENVNSATPIEIIDDVDVEHAEIIATYVPIENWQRHKDGSSELVCTGMLQILEKEDFVTTLNRNKDLLANLSRIRDRRAAEVVEVKSLAHFQYSCMAHDTFDLLQVLWFTRKKYRGCSLYIHRKFQTRKDVKAIDYFASVQRMATETTINNFASKVWVEASRVFGARVLWDPEVNKTYFDLEQWKDVLFKLTFMLLLREIIKLDPQALIKKTLTSRLPVDALHTSMNNKQFVKTNIHVVVHLFLTSVTHQMEYWHKEWRKTNASKPN